MILLGIDPHKSSHTATAMDPAAQLPVATIQIEASLREYHRLLIWTRRWPERRWAIEGATGLGRHLSQRQVARGESVLSVPASATARVRQLSRGGRRKNNAIDAATTATVAATQGDARPIAGEVLLPWFSRTVGEEDAGCSVAGSCQC